VDPTHAVARLRVKLLPGISFTAIVCVFGVQPGAVKVTDLFPEVEYVTLCGPGPVAVAGVEFAPNDQVELAAAPGELKVAGAPTHTGEVVNVGGWLTVTVTEVVNGLAQGGQFIVTL